MPTLTHRLMIAPLVVSLVPLAGCAAGAIGDEAELLDGSAATDEPDVPTSVRDGDQALTIDAPSPDAIFGDMNVPVEGAAEGMDEVVVNGIAVPVVGGRFATQLQLPGGHHIINVLGEQLNLAIPVVVDAESPTGIELTSPTPGAFLYETDGPITVSGQVYDDGIVESVTVNGQEAEVSVDGSFSIRVTPEYGVNTFEVVATDSQGRTDSGIYSVIVGDYAGWDEVTPNAITGSVSALGLQTIGQALVNSFVGGDLDALLAENGALGDQGDFELKRVSYQDLDISLVPQDGYLQANIKIYGLRIDAEAEECFVFCVSVSGNASANPAELDAQVQINPMPDGSVGVSIMNANVNLHSFDLDLDGILGLLDWAIEGLVEDIAEDTLRDVLNDVMIDKLFDPADLTQSVDVLGTSSVFQLGISDISVAPDGVHIATDVGMTTELGPLVSDAPGVIASRGAAPAQALDGHDVRLSLADDFINRLFWSLWRGGALTVDLAELLGDSAELPVDLNVGTFALLAGNELTDHASPDTPVAMVLRAQMPPVASVNPDGSVNAALGETMLDFYLAPVGGDRQLFATVALAIDLDVAFGIVEGQLDVSLALGAQADLRHEPLVDLNDKAFEDVLTGLLATLPTLAGDQLDELFNMGDLTGITEDFPGLMLEPNLTVAADGPQANYLSLFLGLMMQPQQ